MTKVYMMRDSKKQGTYLIKKLRGSSPFRGDKTVARGMTFYVASTFVNLFNQD